MTTNMTSCTFETGWRWENIITWTITCFTLCWHTILNNNETMTFVFDCFTCMTILILEEEEIKSNQKWIFLFLYLWLNHWIRHSWRWIIEQRLPFTIVENLKDFWNHIWINTKYIALCDCTNMIEFPRKKTINCYFQKILERWRFLLEVNWYSC